MRIICISALLLFTAACSNTKYCEREQPFQGANEGPSLRAPEGLTVPEPDPSYVVPQVSTQAQAAALTTDRPCLEMPPLLRNEAAGNAEGQS